MAVPTIATGAVVLAALQASPYRDIDLTQPRVRLVNGAQPLNTLYISVVNIAEIRFGIELQQDPARRGPIE